MKKYSVTCTLGHRLFDVSEGSNMVILIKCANQKECPHKTVCHRKTEIIFGEPISVSGEYEHYACPACNKRLFNASAGSQGAVQIKCDHCGNVVQIKIGMYRLSRQAV